MAKDSIMMQIKVLCGNLESLNVSQSTLDVVQSVGKLGSLSLRDSILDVAQSVGKLDSLSLSESILDDE